MKTTLVLVAVLAWATIHSASALPSTGLAPHKTAVDGSSNNNKSATRSKRANKSQTPSVPAKVVTGRCISVGDGQTLTLLSGRTVTTVRLYAVDAPEKTQDFGAQSKNSLWELAFGQTLAVYPTQKEGGVVCGWVFAGKMGINAEQVKSGWARWDHSEAPNESKMSALESAARSAHLGLWQEPPPATPK